MEGVDFEGGGDVAGAGGAQNRQRLLRPERPPPSRLVGAVLQHDAPKLHLAVLLANKPAVRDLRKTAAATSVNCATGAKN
jgi:hypothetical protein